MNNPGLTEKFSTLKKSWGWTAILLSFQLVSFTVCAQVTLDNGEEKLRIEDLGWSDRNYLDKQVATIDELARTQLGTQVRRNLDDLNLLQRIIDRELIAQDDKQTAQALGAVLGNVLAEDITALEWKIYEDPVGRSRALCVKGTRECLFPITMLSRRMEVGLKPNVNKVYEDAIALMAKHLPQLPYGGGTMRKLGK